MTPAVARSARRPASGREAAATRPAGRTRATATDRARATAGDRAAATAADRAAAPPLPRRLSGPIRGRARTQASPQPATTLGGRALAVVRSLPYHSLLDRLVRGRAWIPVLGILLAGLVAMQVEILKLGTSIGRSIERSTTLQSENESLQARVATLADDQRIERLAAGMGMTMPSPSSVVFVPASAQNAVRRAVENIHVPDPANFAAQLAAQNAAAALIAPVTTGSATTTGAATPSTAATSGASTSAGTTGGPAQAAPGTTSTTSQPAATAPAAGPGDTAQAPPTSASGGTTAASPTDAAPATAATGAAAPTSASPQSDSPPGG